MTIGRSIHAAILAAFMLLLAAPHVSGSDAGAASPEKVTRLPSLPAAPLKVSPENLDRAATLGAKFLVERCGEDGQFMYRTHLDPSLGIRVQYNMLRHAGTMYALATHHQGQPNEKLKSMILRAAKFLRSQIGPVSDAEDRLAVWSRREVTRVNAPLKAKLGGAGLALVALLNVERVAPGTTPKAELEALGRFILYMQKDDGSFYSRYIPARGGRDDSWTSLYYPGEAALGLVLLYEETGDVRWLQGAADALGYLADHRKNDPGVPPDHWALLATAELLPHYEKCRPKVPREGLLRHARQIIDDMLAAQDRLRDKPQLAGGFDPAGRTTPTATRLEGLLASLTFLPQETDAQRRYYRRVEQCCRRGIGFLLAAQVKSGRFAGAVPRSVVLLPDGHGAFSRGHNRAAGEVRIDYVQHAMSAWMQARDVLPAK